MSLKALARDLVEVGTESFELIWSDADARSHSVAAMTHEKVGAFAESGGKIKTSDTAPGAAPFGAVAANNDGGAIKLLEDA